MSFRILDTQWHIGHQYEMLKFPFATWTWLKQYRRPLLDRALRGDITSMFKEVLHYERDQYDAAILHLDQECFGEREWNRGKGVIYRDLNELIQDIPKIVIMHGTPHRAEAKHPLCCPDYMRAALKDAVGDNTLIVNSHQAASEWQMGSPIIHGIDQNEWFDLPKLPRVITTLSSKGMDSYYDRAFLDAVRQDLLARDIEHCHIGVDFIPGTWDEYRTMIGKSLIYFNPTFSSPMPRARTEAMMSGCCVITTPHHDAASFIVDGVNGFIVERDAAYVGDLIESLVCNSRKTVEIGAAGRETAKTLFAWDRFACDWHALLEGVVNPTYE